ncbi:MAG: antA/AntB antirepressor family protein [Chlorobium sp.]|nr:antA/AntB antirepressor family protein [Chlorobium sp.]
MSKVIENPFFAENQDYVLLDNIIKQTSRGGYNRKDYALTVNTAKKVSMAEQTPTGDEFRALNEQGLMAKPVDDGLIWPSEVIQKKEKKK